MKHLSPLVVCERTGAWAVALRAALGDAACLVYETRNFDDCRAALEAAPQGMAAIEAAAVDLEEMLSTVIELSRHGAPVVVLAARQFLPHETLFREAGAVQVVYSRRQAPLAARLFLRRAALAIPPSRPLPVEIWEHLPWPDARRPDAKGRDAD
ncbi:hypothetical protein [Lignipirellula cremea]|uniref:Response regulatory domain-containing protein n=1 Tax=Lignipirellula cremea TaxID=2528010 RepID=A0A518DN03_9BACT|nr:hypothetical protein [Lignipirellula cremea]QDU93218.1 hypothetical protein Pla8534_09970 [Lignipirellula cremea]